MLSSYMLTFFNKIYTLRKKTKTGGGLTKILPCSHPHAFFFIYLYNNNNNNKC
ncbi:hypothetical protein Hanom_Chr04g00316831 [Helianthus anomalus]